MEGLIVIVVLSAAATIIIAAIRYSINWFYRQIATEYDEVKFKEDSYTARGTIVRDFGNTLEVQCMKPNAYGEIIPTIIVVQRDEIFYF